MVGPRYNTKYKTAAESALFMCYRNVLQLARYVFTDNHSQLYCYVKLFIKENPNFQGILN